MMLAANTLTKRLTRGLHRCRWLTTLGLLAACGGTPNIEQGEKPAGSGGGSRGGAQNTSVTGGSGPIIDLNGGNAGATAGGAAGSHACQGIKDPGCTLAAQGPACGDSTVDVAEGEECDDGNGLPGDGCSGACKIENKETWACPTTGGACTSTIVCGDGKVQGAEICDDGNALSGDGCLGDCSRLEMGFDCPLAGGACTKLCGNGKLEGLEECDDAGLSSGDGCSATCAYEPGYRCPTPGQPCIADTRCGNGKVEPGEGCDDANAVTGDGCSAACSVEPYWSCPTGGGACSYTVRCGDGVVTPGVELCDTGTAPATGCDRCAAIDPLYDCTTPGVACARIQTCGNGILEGTEACDTGWTGGTEGCAADCSRVNTAEGYVCFSGKCFLPYTAACGNGIIDTTEQCDNGPSSDPGCIACKKTTGYVCTTPGQPCIKETCGDGIRTPGEQCDDHNAKNADGCTTTCTVEAGWTCPEPNKPCVPKCGDGLLKGHEQCDAPTAGGVRPAHCNAGCMLETGYYCTTTTGTIGSGNLPTLTTCSPATPTARLVLALCGNGAREPGEGCDDGNQIAGDGCTPTCQREPTCTRDATGVCTFAPTCGNGAIEPGEACDDGNSASGDGCSSTCATETGYTCTTTKGNPTSVTLPIAYRDFRARADSTGARHPDFEEVDGAHGLVLGIPGHVCTPTSNSPTTGQVCDATHNTACCGRLDASGKPVLNDRGGAAIPRLTSTAANFAQWYTDVAGINVNVPRNLQLDRQGPAGDYSYVYDSTLMGVRCNETISNGGFYPLDFTADCTPSNNIGWGDQSGNNGHNYSFTSELRYFFQYGGGERLDFFGDDDVWVYINGRLAVDIGGIHGQEPGAVLLGDENADGTLSNAESTDTTDDRFSITKGRVYEIVVFQAERNEVGSNYKLTLKNFILGRSTCTSICGDGTIQPGETCDDGQAENTGEYGHCNATCTAKRFCGDGIKDTEEICDNGVNKDGYGDIGAGKCAPGCIAPPRCGDSLQQTPYGEQCDLGPANNSSQYNGCTTQCLLGPRCGDGVTQTAAGEICDAGINNGGYGAASMCGYDCKPAPRCGDGVRQPPETCDEGDENDSALYGGCKLDCSLGPRCGDGFVQAANGETCDNGVSNDDLLYGGCKTTCQLGPRCGDGVKNGLEACDLGAQNANGSYGGCQSNCTLGPRCGDGLVQATAGEVCDAGDNNGRYGFCASDCKSEVRCGDGIKNGPEQCDNGSANADDAYNGCRSDCTLGPRCGDGVKNGTEICDDGQNLGGYGQCAPGCKLGARCGDGVVQASAGEQCDDGQNLGGYGQCAAGCRLGPRCGDLIVQSAAGEQCDDGNTTNGDTCSASCRTESWVIQ